MSTDAPHAAPTGGQAPRRLGLLTGLMTLALVILACDASNTVIATAPVNGSPPAAPGPVSTHEVAQTATIPFGATDSVVATCPQGELALSGGWDIPPTGARVYAANIVSNGWSVGVRSFPPTNAIARVVGTPPAGQPVGTPVTAYVECLRGAGGTVTAVQRTETDSIAPTVPNIQADAARGPIRFCQAGEGLVGFGFDLGAAAADKLELELSWPSDYLHAYLWSFKVWNFDTVAHDVSFSVQCLTTTRGGSTAYPSQQGAGHMPNLTTTTAVDCPAGALVAGGGFQYGIASRFGRFAGNEYSLHATATGWQSSMIAFVSDGEFPINPSVAAVCMTLA